MWINFWYQVNRLDTSDSFDDIVELVSPLRRVLTAFLVIRANPTLPPVPTSYIGAKLLRVMMLRCGGSAFDIGTARKCRVDDMHPVPENLSRVKKTGRSPCKLKWSCLKLQTPGRSAFSPNNTVLRFDPYIQI